VNIYIVHYHFKEISSACSAETNVG